MKYYICFTQNITGFFLLLLLYISNVIVAKASVHFGMANGTTKYELSDDRGYTWTTSALVQRGLAARGMINNTYMHPSHSTYPTNYELSDDRGYTWTTSALVQRGLSALIIGNRYAPTR